MKPDCFVSIYESEIDLIVDECEQHPDTETGGSLFGLWTHGLVPIICLATRPGPGAVKTHTHFQQDPDIHNSLQQVLWEKFRLQWIGLWHSHHRLGLHELSAGDVLRTMTVATRHQKQRFTDILCFFTNTTDGRRTSETNLKPFLYSNAGRGQIVSSEIDVISGSSPFRDQPPRYSRGVESAMRAASRRAKYRLQPTESLSIRDLPQEDEQVEETKGQSKDGPPKLRESIDVSDPNKSSPSPVERVAAALEPLLATLPVTLQESIEIEDAGNGKVRLDLATHTGDHIRLAIDASGDLVVQQGELTQTGHGRRQTTSLEFMRSGSLVDYVKEVIQHLRY